MVISRHKGQCKLLDMREIVKSRNQNTNNIRHYIRPVYVRMAEELMSLLSGESIRVRLTTKIERRVKAFMKRVKGKLKLN
jgi:hypothetical protein